MVVSFLTISVLKNPAVQKLFGSKSSLLNKFRSSIQYSYRHGRPGLEDNGEIAAGTHESFFNREQNESRYFSPVTAYEN